MSETTDTMSRTKVLTGNGVVWAGAYPAYCGG